MIRSKDERIFEFVGYIVMGLLSIMAILPFWLLIAGSFTENNAAARNGYQFWPSEFSMEAYLYILAQWNVIGRSYGITIVITICGTIFSLLLASSIGYGLAQRNVPGQKIVTIFVLFTILFNGGMVSSYIVYTNLLHLKNTIFALIIPNLLLNGFTVLIVRNFFRQDIPPELTEAAEIDGAGVFRIYWQIALPLSKPIMATIGLLATVSYWNDWTNGLYYITDSEMYSIQQLLNEINQNIQFLTNNAGAMIGGVGITMPSISIRMAIAVVAILPILIAYPFFQKYFAKGIAMGGVKG